MSKVVQIWKFYQAARTINIGMPVTRQTTDPNPQLKGAKFPATVAALLASSCFPAFK